MAFLDGSIQFKVYTDSAETEFPEELVADITKALENSAVTEVETVVISLAAAGSQTISLNGVGTVKYWYIYSSAQNCTLDVNGLGASLTLQAGVPGFIPITLSSLAITNASASAATTVTLIMIAS